jgi:RNA polymerase sigma-70 factor (ECF subfamily)
MEDENIVDLYLRRDEDAIKQTEIKYGKKLLSLSVGITQDRQDAEECCDSTYFEVWNTIPPNEPRTYFFAYIARICRHISLDLCRSRSRQKRNAMITVLSDELDICFASPDDTDKWIDDNALKKALNDFLSSLDEDSRDMFIRRYWYMDSTAELVRKFGKSEGSIKMALLRMRQSLRLFLEKEGIRI